MYNTLKCARFQASNPVSIGFKVFAISQKEEDTNIDA